MEKAKLLLINFFHFYFIYKMTKTVSLYNVQMPVTDWRWKRWWTLCLLFSCRFVCTVIRFVCRLIHLATNNLKWRQLVAIFTLTASIQITSSNQYKQSNSLLSNIQEDRCSCRLIRFVLFRSFFISSLISLVCKC